MAVLFAIVLYIVVASASVFGLIVAAEKADMLGYDPDIFDLAGYVACGIFWPFCLFPCLACIGAKWYIENQDESGENAR